MKICVLGQFENLPRFAVVVEVDAELVVDVREVVLLERESFFGLGATVRCAGGIRHQFATEVNIRLSLLSLRMLDALEEETGQPALVRKCGYLFVLTRPQDIEEFEPNVALQQSLGVPTEWLTGDEVRRRLPVCVFPDALAGTFCAWDSGWRTAATGRGLAIARDCSGGADRSGDGSRCAAGVAGCAAGVCLSRLRSSGSGSMAHHGLMASLCSGSCSVTEPSFVVGSGHTRVNCRRVRTPRSGRSWPLPPVRSITGST